MRLPVGPRAGRTTALLGVSIVLTAINLRSAVSSVGALLPDIQHALQIAPSLVGVLTALPVLVFAIVGPLAPRLERRWGLAAVSSVGLIMMAVGTLLRPVAAEAVAFFAASLMAYAGCAIVNVLLPAIVQRQFAHRVGMMTALYSAAIAVGVAAASTFSVPLAQVSEYAWRAGLGVWALPMIVAVGVWLGVRPAGGRRDVELVVGSRGAVRHQKTAAPAQAMRLSRNAGAWATAVYFGTQGLQSYVAISWLPRFFQDEGMSASAAGALVGLLLIIAVPISLIVPSLVARISSPRSAVLVLAGSYFAGYVCLAIDGQSLALLGVIFIGIGAGAFPLALTVIGSWSPDSSETSRFSGFVQAVGYLVAAFGPVIAGIVYGGTSPAIGLLTLLLCACGVQVVAGLIMAHRVSARWRAA
ncbi:MFS transporter [Cryobacterium melibiosiphilum]|uniref:MFS transporter n=1 Tax=Cryobacterium melibiosiphilum TaxID=995039 RepID=A0A3A5MZC0_9MICO|nr:MFS transporter [Cryobacterium melibiosiphilum]RJT90454.1 MFS transporter [Cryobacterium melibiosiphilum]